MRNFTPDILLPFIHIDRQEVIPIYIQLYQQVKSAIFNGMLKHGDRMPSSRNLSFNLHISRNCVILAFEQLALEGFLMTKTGSGTFVCEQLNELKPDKKTNRVGKSLMQESLEPATDLPGQILHYTSVVATHTALEIPLPFQPSLPSFSAFPFKTWSKIATSVYRDMHRLHLGYSSAQGHLPLREAITTYLRLNRSIDCSPDQIVIVNGSSQALNLISEFLLKKGDLCWMEDPGYLWAKSAFLRFGGKVCPVPITIKGFDLDYAMQNYSGARLAYVTPSHQFPLGKTMPLPERMKLLKVAAEHNMWVVEDDYESEYRYVNRPIPALKGLDTFGRVIHIGSFNKTIFPALRIGYIVFPTTEMARQITVLKAMTDRQGPIIEQAILTHFMNDGYFLQHLRRMRLLYRKSQQNLIDLLNQYFGQNIRISATEAGMHLIVWFKEGWHHKDIAQLAKKSGIILYAVDDLSIKFKNPGAYIVGFTGFSTSAMEQAVINLKELLS